MNSMPSPSNCYQKPNVSEIIVSPGLLVDMLVMEFDSIEISVLACDAATKHVDPTTCFFSGIHMA